MEPQKNHIPVLLNEVLSAFNPQPGQLFIDATINGGGHSLALLDHIKPDGRILGFEWDPDIFVRLMEKKASLDCGDRVLVVNESYTNLTAVAHENGFDQVDGILFDFGISSWHVDESIRGFSFQKDQSLDMRFNPAEQDRSAIHIVNSSTKEELRTILKDFGEERFAGRIADGIIESRRRQRIITTKQLVEVIQSSVPSWYRHQRIHPATRTFQALRIAVNHELENIAEGLKQAIGLLKPGGKLLAISFHSLEDRIVKNFIRDQAKNSVLKIITKKPIRAGSEEEVLNPRSRSAHLRIARKL